MGEEAGVRSIWLWESKWRLASPPGQPPNRAEESLRDDAVVPLGSAACDGMEDAAGMCPGRGGRLACWLLVSIETDAAFRSSRSFDRPPPRPTQPNPTQSGHRGERRRTRTALSSSCGVHWVEGGAPIHQQNLWDNGQIMDRQQRGQSSRSACFAGCSLSASAQRTFTRLQRIHARSLAFAYCSP